MSGAEDDDAVDTATGTVVGGEDDAAPTAEVVHQDLDGSPESIVPACIARRGRTQIQTVRLDSRDLRPSWPLAIASLEQLSSWAVLALRLGTLALIQQCVRELAEEDARAEVIVRLRALTEALAHMPLEA